MIKRKVAACAGLTVLLSALNGCGFAMNPTEYSENVALEEVHLAVILGSHANAPQPNLSLIEPYVYEACYTYGSVTLICDDGAPYSLVIDIPEQQAHLSEAKYKTIANDETKQILQAANQMQAKTSEVDTLKAIQLGARSLQSIETEVDNAEVVKEMVILDSCLSATGVLSFVDQRINSISAEDLVTEPQELNNIPNLEGVSTIVYTSGDTSGMNQAKLTESNRESLKSIWQAILEAGNGDVTMKDDLPLSDTYDESTLPTVTSVIIEEDSADIHSIEETENTLQDGGIISFNETSVAFVEGSSELKDEDEAKTALAYIAQCMEQQPDLRLLIVGTTACWGGEDYCIDLSESRSEEICRLLVEMGIDGNRLKSVGVGYSFPEFYIPDQKADGTLDESIAPLNRSVKIVSLDSDTANQILNAAY